jgi:hypothetical protein
VAGPLDVIGSIGAGALDNDLRAAVLEALKVPRAAARAHALQYSWNQVARLFLSYLAPIPRGT